MSKIKKYIAATTVAAMFLTVNIVPISAAPLGLSEDSAVNVAQPYAVGDYITVDNICYRITGDTTVSVANPTYPSNPDYSTYTDEITIPASIEYSSTTYSVTGIADTAFTDATVTKVTLPATITTISGAAFQRCTSLTEISITDSLENPSQLTTIGDQAFTGCTSLATLNLPDSVTTIGRSAFNNCQALETLAIPAAITSGLRQALNGYPHPDGVTIDEGSQYSYEGGILYNGQVAEYWLDRSITDITIKDGITEIGPAAFAASQGGNTPRIESIVLPDSVTIIGNSAFSDTNLESIDLTNVTEIEGSAFINSDELVDVTWPQNLTSMGQSAFMNCTSLNNVEIQGTITEIPYQAFLGCSALEQVTLNEGLETIGDYAFDTTTEQNNDGVWINPDPQLTSIHIPSTVTSVGTNFLGGVSANTALIFEGDTPPNFETNALAGISGDGVTSPVVYYPADATEAYTAEGSDLLTSGLVTAPTPGEQPANSYDLTVTGPSATLYAGDQFMLDVQSVVPQGGSLVVTSSDPSVATVTVTTDNAVIVRAVGEGSATITVSVVDQNSNVLISQSVAVSFAERPYNGKYSYEIVSDVGENGTIDVDRYATEGDQVTITVSPDEAYLLDDLTVTSGGKDVALTDNGDGTYSFTMPSGDVAVTATFAEDPNWEEPEDPATDVSEIFTDVPANHWAKAAIQYVYDNGIMTGVSDTAFAPEATTTRAMIVSMLARMENVTSAANAGFADVDAGDWYATAVNWAAANGIVSGISGDTFAPNDPITREQLAAMLMNYAQYKGMDVSARADLSGYSDAPSAWAEDVVSWAVAEGLLAGVTDDQLQPQGQASRAQVAAILERFLEA